MSNIVEQLHGEAEHAASTDTVGMNGEPIDSHYLWKQVSPSARILSEVVTWQHVDVADLGKLAGGYHGRIGNETSGQWLDDIKVVGLNNLMKPTVQLISEVGQVAQETGKDRYVLVHQPEADAIQLENFTNIPSGVVIAIENHVQLGALGKAKDALRRIKEKGIQCVFVFDIVHFLKEGLKLPDLERWEQMLVELNSIGQCFVHLPIGTNPDDSLPFDKISDAMWQGLARVIQHNHLLVIIEHQYKGLMQNIRKQPQKDKKLIQELQRKVYILQKHHIIPPERVRQFH